MKRKNSKKSWIVLSVVLGLLLAFSLIPATGSDIGQKLLDRFKDFEPVEPLLPPDVQVKPVFVAGKEAAVGFVQKIQGTVYVIHKDEKNAYLLKNDYQVFSGDTLITAARSRVNAVMNDRSSIALAPNTKLVIDKSVYDPEKDTRSSLFGLLFGRARFIVKKLTGSGTPNFSVKTPTAVCGIRGSDFALSVGPAGEETSSIRKFFKSLSPVKEAHALVQVPMLTAVVTGQATTVGFAGAIGAVQTVGPLSVCSAMTGAAATSSVFVGTAALGTLATVAPQMAALSMPPHFD